jgi:hypothetical protein
MLALQQKATRVVVEISQHMGQLVLMKKEAVVVAWFPEGAYR